MKRITILCIILMFCITICSCGTETSHPEDKSSEIQLISGSRSLAENGAYHSATVSSVVKPNRQDQQFFESVLKYTDFATMKSVIVCSKPNCPHNDPDSSCSAFGMDNHAVQIGENLYFFENVIEYDKDGNLVTYSNVWRAALDGNERVKLGSLEDFVLRNGSAAAVIGERIYFVGVKEGSYSYSDISADKSSLAGDKFYFCRYDFSKKKFTNFGFLGTGFSGGGGINGRFNGKLYFSVSYQEELVDWSHFSGRFPESTDRFYCFDFETEELAPSDMPSIAKGGIVTDDYYGIRTNGGELRACNTSGEEKLYSGYAFDYTDVMNGYVFNYSNGTALNLDTGEIKRLKPGMVGKDYSGEGYRNGKYIFYVRNSKNLSSAGFVCIDEKDIFVE